MEELYNQDKIIQHEYSAEVNYYKTKSDVKMENYLCQKYIYESNNFLWYLMTGVFFILFLGNIYKIVQATDMHQSLFEIIPMILTALLFILFSVYCIFIPNYIDNSLIRRYNKFQYNQYPFSFVADNDGIIVSNKVYSARVNWSEINEILEHEKGFIIEWGGKSTFIPARYLDIDTVIRLRNIFNHLARKRMRCISEIKIEENSGEKIQFKMVDIEGDPIYDFQEEITFSQYRKGVAFLNRRLGFKLALMFSPIFITVIALAIFTMESVWSALIGILIVIILIDIIFSMFIYTKSKIGFEENKRYKNAHIALHKNAVLYESDGIVKVIEYKHITNVKNIADNLMIISKSSDVIRIACYEKSAEIYNFLNLKTML